MVEEVWLEVRSKIDKRFGKKIENKDKTDHCN